MPLDLWVTSARESQRPRERAMVLVKLGKYLNKDPQMLGALWGKNI